MKRFTATEKWADPWFRKLKPEYKVFWEFICDNCDNSGVWKVDMELAVFYIGVDLGLDECLKVFDGRIMDIGKGKWWLPKFIKFQYGQLSEKSEPHKRVATTLKDHGIWSIYLEYYGFNTSPKTTLPTRVSDTPVEEEVEEEEEEEEASREKGTGEKPIPPPSPPTGPSGDDRWHRGRLPKPLAAAGDAEAMEKGYRLGRVALAHLNEKAGIAYSEASEVMDQIAAGLIQVNFDLDGVKVMIDRKVDEWIGQPKTRAWLKPSTLFGAKFTEYYAQRLDGGGKVGIEGLSEKIETHPANRNFVKYDEETCTPEMREDLKKLIAELAEMEIKKPHGKSD